MVEIGTGLTLPTTHAACAWWPPNSTWRRCTGLLMDAFNPVWRALNGADTGRSPLPGPAGEGYQGRKDHIRLLLSWGPS